VSEGSTRNYVLDRALALPAAWVPSVEHVTEFAGEHARALDLVTKIISLQGPILEVRNAWERLDTHLFGGRSDRAIFEKKAVENGVFKQFVLAAVGEENLNNVLLSSYVSLSGLKNSRQIIQAWQANMKLPREKKTSIDQITIPATSETDEYEDANDLELSPHQAFERVKRAQEGIVDRLRRADLTHARRFADALVSEQVAHGGNQFASKTLCALGYEAGKLGYISLELEWELRAIDLSPEDAWAYGQAALTRI
jgi:hypothetical protein